MCWAKARAQAFRNCSTVDCTVPRPSSTVGRAIYCCVVDVCQCFQVGNASSIRCLDRSGGCECLSVISGSHNQRPHVMKIDCFTWLGCGRRVPDDLQGSVCQHLSRHWPISTSSSMPGRASGPGLPPGWGHRLQAPGCFLCRNDTRLQLPPHIRS